MTLEEIITEIGKAEPALMNKTATLMAATEQFYPDFIQGIKDDLNTIVNVLNEKVASVVPQKADWGRWAVGIGASAAAGLLSSMAADAYDAAKRGFSKGRNFDRIMAANPHLKREVDNKQLMAAYNALHRYAPEFTADPMVGGVLLKNIAEFPQMSHKAILELIGARKDLRDTKHNPFQDFTRQTPFLLGQDPRKDHDKHESGSERGVKPGPNAHRVFKPGE